MADKTDASRSFDSTVEKPVVVQEAQHAADTEKSMSLKEAIRLYPKAVGWSVVLSSALIMEGYDLALLGSLYASPQFNMKYGVQNAASGKWSVPAPWQSALYVLLSCYDEHSLTVADLTALELARSLASFSTVSLPRNMVSAKL